MVGQGGTREKLAGAGAGEDHFGPSRGGVSARVGLRQVGNGGGHGGERGRWTGVDLGLRQGRLWPEAQQKL